MKTRVKDIVKSIIDEIDNLDDFQNSDAILVVVESRLAMEKLNDFLGKQIELNQEATIQNLKPFLDLVSERWLNIKNTDAIYSHHSHTIANRAYFILAKHLSKVLNISIYDVLMPTVTAVIFQTSRGNLASFNPNEFILSDDGVPIEVVKCLADAANSGTNQLRHTDNSKRMLNKSEQERIINHSDKTLRYYQMITVSHASVRDQAKAELDAAILQSSYQVNASYGDAGKKRLAKYLMANLKSKQDLINVMLRCMPQNKWKAFINEIGDEDLIQATLEDDSLMNVLQGKTNYKEDQTYNKALLFCLTEVYWRHRRKGGEASMLTRITNGYLSSWIIQKKKYWIGGCNLKEKEAGVILLQGFLMSKLDLGERDKYIKEYGTEEEINALINDRTSLLAMIAEQVKLVGDSAYFQPQDSSKSWGIFGF